MKRVFLTLVFLSAALGLLAQSAEETMSYYQGSGSLVNRLELLKQIVSESGSGAAEFYGLALASLVVEYPSVRGNQELNAADQIAQILAEQLGEARYGAAAADLGRLVESFTNPLPRGAALIALGKMHEATNNYYLAQTAQILQNLNNNPPAQDREGAERLAYRAILALEQYQDNAGYLPVFFASHSASWYPELVRKQASDSLTLISDDPSEPLVSVIRSPAYTVEVKFAALQTLDSSSIPGERKSEAAVTGYTEAWRIVSPEPRQNVLLANMRKLAQRMIYQWGTENSAVLGLLERSYKEGLDTQERYNAVNTLSSLAARGNLEEQSIGLLGAFLIALNGKCSDGSLTPADEAMVRVLIPALGNTRKPGAVRPLNTVQSVPWTNAVKRLARTALGTISG
ncbi:MAG: hypothetical protein LBQ35_02210 [Spirochaetaceae bacterium]|jgi:hypothetical protein|nr:hypothetical protein [Spirochaetaceae bacterium]